MDLEEKKAFIGFNIFEGIGPQRFKLLYQYFGSAKASFNASEKELISVGLSEKLVLRFINFRRNWNFSSYFLRLRSFGIEAICSEEENYPKLLKEINDKPPVLYIKSKEQRTNDIGDFFNKKAIAVVGTRKVTAYGRQVTEMITEGLVSAGLVIISGLARGVDAIAHETTINSRGITLGVLGCGLDLVYPPEHIKLAERIIDGGGALISELPLGMQPVPGNFPARNRIISGLSLGVVVTEAAEDSGSLITASLAGEQGREVFAVPGPITSPLSAGTADLIKKGAKLVSGVKDILEELSIKVSEDGKLPKVSKENLSKEEISIVEILENENMHINEIIRVLKSDSGIIGGILSMMEIKGIVKNYGEGIYGLC